jgi:hypothetical protein
MPRPQQRTPGRYHQKQHYIVEELEEARKNYLADQWNEKYTDFYATSLPHYGKHEITATRFQRGGAGKPILCCSLHPKALSKPRAPPTPPAPKEQDLMILADLRQYLVAEIQALKLELASLRCLSNDILTEVKKKPTPPETAPAPPSQQQTEKPKQTTLGGLSPMPRAPTKAVRWATSPKPSTPPNPPNSPNPANRTTSPPPRSEDTEMQLVLAAEADPTMIASDSDGGSTFRQFSIYLDSPSVTMAKECTALEIEDGQALRRIAGLRRKHQVEERKVEGALDVFIYFFLFVRLPRGSAGVPQLTSLL